QTSQVAADTEATKTFELAVAVEHRQTGHLNRQSLVEIVERPKQDDAAEGFARSKRAGDLALWIKVQGLGDINPGAIEWDRARFRTKQSGEFVADGDEVRIGVGLPDKTKGRIARARLRLAGVRPRCRCSCNGRGACWLGGRRCYRSGKQDKQPKCRSRPK